jgi:hypothetical protein
LLERLRPLTDEVVLIGGQALSFWAERFSSAEELSASGPHTSKDIDFFGDQKRVEQCARILEATPHYYSPSDRTVSAGYVVTSDGVHVDFVHSPKGLKPGEIHERAIAFPSLRVMHPVHVMKSRAANVVHIPRTDAHALKQLRASAYVVREFIRRDVVASGAIKPARKLNEWAFEVAGSSDGLEVWRRHAVDLFEAVLLDPRLGEKYAPGSYARMQREITRRRGRALRP